MESDFGFYPLRRRAAIASKFSELIFQEYRKSLKKRGSPTFWSEWINPEDLHSFRNHSPNQQPTKGGNGRVQSHAGSDSVHP
jgi:hypothetical protein